MDQSRVLNLNEYKEILNGIIDEYIRVKGTEFLIVPKDKNWYYSIPSSDVFNLNDPTVEAGVDCISDDIDFLRVVRSSKYNQGHASLYHAVGVLHLLSTVSPYDDEPHMKRPSATG